MTLVESASKIAVDAAIAYLKKQGKLSLSMCNALEEPLKRHSQAALAEALEDAQLAIDCGMTEAGKMTFRASMALAGIRAAQEACG